MKNTPDCLHVREILRVLDGLGVNREKIDATCLLPVSERARLKCGDADFS
jgi:hypothetical protein